MSSPDPRAISEVAKFVDHDLSPDQTTDTEQDTLLLINDVLR